MCVSAHCGWAVVFASRAPGDEAGGVIGRCLVSSSKQHITCKLPLLVCGCRRWQELGSVLSSPGLLQDSMQAAVHAAASQLPSSQRCSPAAHAAQPGSRRAGAGSRTSSGQLAGAAQPAEVQHPALKLGDVVVLGKSKAVKGKIRWASTS